MILTPGAHTPLTCHGLLDYINGIGVAKRKKTLPESEQIRDILNGDQFRKVVHPNSWLIVCLLLYVSLLLKMYNILCPCIYFLFLKTYIYIAIFFIN